MTSLFCFLLILIVILDHSQGIPIFGFLGIVFFLIPKVVGCLVTKKSCWDSILICTILTSHIGMVYYCTNTYIQTYTEESQSLIKNLEEYKQSHGQYPDELSSLTLPESEFYYDTYVNDTDNSTHFILRRRENFTFYEYSSANPTWRIGTTID